VVPHVLYSASDGDVVRTHGDASRNRCGSRHRSRTPAVNGESRHTQRQSGKNAHRTTENQALVASLGGGSESNLINGLGWDVRVSLEETNHRLDHNVVGTRRPVNALLACPTERGANAVNK
jgi:hypothetical protein